MQNTPRRRPASTPLLAIIKWPTGLDHDPVIYPNAGSEELDETIREIFRRAFSKKRIQERRRFNMPRDVA